MVENTNTDMEKDMYKYMSETYKIVFRKEVINPLESVLSGLDEILKEKAMFIDREEPKELLALLIETYISNYDKESGFSFDEESFIDRVPDDVIIELFESIHFAFVEQYSLPKKEEKTEEKKEIDFVEVMQESDETVEGNGNDGDSMELTY